MQLQQDIENLKKNNLQLNLQLEHPNEVHNKEINNIRTELTRQTEETKNLQAELQKYSRDYQKLKEAMSANECSLKNTIQQLEKQRDDLLEKNNQLNKKILELGSSAAENGQKFRFSESTQAKKLEESNHLEKRLYQQKQQLEGRSSHALTCKQTNGHLATTSNFRIEPNALPSCYIRIKTVFALSKKGWPVTTTKPEQLSRLQNTKIAVIGIIGASGSGKSWLSYAISGDSQPYSLHENSNTISLQYMGRDSVYFGVLDFKGYDAPLQANDDSFLSGLSEEFRPQEKVYETLSDNFTLIEDLKLDYLVKHSGLLIFIVNRFTYNDHVILQKLARKLNQCYKNQPKAATPQLLIVHNLRHLISIEEAEEELKILKKSFILEEQPLFNTQDETAALRGANSKLFKDQFGYTHLIIAASDSEAGRHYNPGSLKFVGTKINTLETKTELNFAESFSDHCNQELPLMLDMKLNVKYDSAQKKIVAANATQIKPSDLSLYDPLKNVFSQTKFVPRYTVTHKILESKTKLVTVEVDVLNSKIGKTALKSRDGWHYFVLSGERVNGLQEDDRGDSEEDKYINSNEERLKGTREFGPFQLSIKLVRGMKNQKVQKYEPANGTMKIEFWFSQEEDMAI